MSFRVSLYRSRPHDQSGDPTKYWVITDEDEDDNNGDDDDVDDNDDVILMMTWMMMTVTTNIKLFCLPYSYCCTQY